MSHPDGDRQAIRYHRGMSRWLLLSVVFSVAACSKSAGPQNQDTGKSTASEGGEKIALSARIVCVADVFDALTTDRPYRRAFTWDEALNMMAKDVGKMFDPDLFPRFERIMRTPDVYRLPDPPKLAFAS